MGAGRHGGPGMMSDSDHWGPPVPGNPLRGGTGSRIARHFQLPQTVIRSIRERFLAARTHRGGPGSLPHFPSPFPFGLAEATPSPRSPLQLEAQASRQACRQAWGAGATGHSRMGTVSESSGTRGPTWFPRERWVTGHRPGPGTQVGRSLDRPGAPGAGKRVPLAPSRLPKFLASPSIPKPHVG